MSQLGTDRLPPGFGDCEHRSFTLGTTEERTGVALVGRVTSTPLDCTQGIPALVPAQAQVSVPPSQVFPRQNKGGKVCVGRE